MAGGCSGLCGDRTFWLITDHCTGDLGKGIGLEEWNVFFTFMQSCKTSIGTYLVHTSSFPSPDSTAQCAFFIVCLLFPSHDAKPIPVTMSVGLIIIPTRTLERQPDKKKTPRAKPVPHSRVIIIKKRNKRTIHPIILTLPRLPSLSLSLSLAPPHACKHACIQPSQAQPVQAQQVPAPHPPHDAQLEELLLARRRPPANVQLLRPQRLPEPLAAAVAPPPPPAPAAALLRLRYRDAAAVAAAAAAATAAATAGAAGELGMMVRVGVMGVLSMLRMVVGLVLVVLGMLVGLVVLVVMPRRVKR